MTTVMTIVHSTFDESIKKIVVLNPQHIPRIGECVDMGIEPVSRVIKILYKYPHEGRTEIFVVVDL